MEIFRRALSPSEIQAIYKAGHGGKCKIRCHTKWNHPFCKNQNVVTVPVTLCNDSAAAAPFLLNFTGLPAGPGCSIAGPTSFAVVGPNPVNVPAFTCVTVNVQITRPVGMNATFQVGCYDVTIQNLSTGQITTCRGSVIDRRDLCGKIIWPPMDIIDITLGTPAVLNFEVVNQTLAPITTPIKVVPQLPPSKIIQHAVSLNGLPPGMPVIENHTFDPEARSPVTIPVQVTFVEHEGLDLTDIALYTDIDGDGEFEPLTSATVRSKSRRHCPADIAPAGVTVGDGVVNVNDLLAVINNWGACGDCSFLCVADIAPPGGDCAVNVNDLLAVINAWGPCPQ